VGFDSTSGSAAAHSSWAYTRNRNARTQAARDARRARILAAVDPEGLMSPADRAKAEKNAMQAHMLNMSIKAAKARTAAAKARKKA
jgi:hypothetical protein